MAPSEEYGSGVPRCDGGKDIGPSTDVMDGWPSPCPECEHGHLEVADGVFAECNNCDAAVLRMEVGI